MNGIERSASAVWKGSLSEGRGTIEVGSGAFAELPYSWGSRTREPGGMTGPEELLAAAHAQCFAMSLANTLQQEFKAKPERLSVSAVCLLEPVSRGFKITSMRLHVHALVPEIDAPHLQQAVQKAHLNCPISNALRGNVPVQLTAELEAPKR